MSNIDTGGPAFATPAVIDHDSGEIAIDAVPGMTLLDWFAGKALASCIIVIGGTTPHSVSDAMQQYECTNQQELCCKIAYQFADAMIAEKRRREGGK